METAMAIFGLTTKRGSAAALTMVLAALGGCDTATKAPPSAAPVLGMYRNLAEAGARIDAETAAEMIGSYRRNHGLKPLALDPALMRVATAEADAMAAAAKPASADGAKAKAARAGYRAPAANVSAGYQTFAEAFSGWRESAAHDRVMLDAGADRMGIATAYAPGTKYRVFWTLVVAGAPR
jgi:uncharacterized protein YkwD